MPVKQKRIRRAILLQLENSSQKSANAVLQARNNALSSTGEARSARLRTQRARKSALCAAVPTSHICISSASASRSDATADQDSTKRTTTRATVRSVHSELTSVITRRGWVSRAALRTVARSVLSESGPLGVLPGARRSIPSSVAPHWRGVSVECQWSVSARGSGRMQELDRLNCDSTATQLRCHYDARVVFVLFRRRDPPCWPPWPPAPPNRSRSRHPRARASCPCRRQRGAGSASQSWQLCIRPRCWR